MSISSKQANQLFRAALIPVYLCLPLLLPMHPERFALALTLVVSGVAWRVWANGHVDKGERICEEGPYALCRNPMYVGSLVGALGYFLLWGDWRLTAGLWLSVLVLEGWRARLEAGRLGARFGMAYEDYRRRTPMFLPRPAQVVHFLRGRTPRGTFNLRRLWDNGEVHRLVHVYVGIVALWAMWEVASGGMGGTLATPFVRSVVAAMGSVVAFIAARAVPRGLTDLFSVEFSWHAGRALLRMFSRPTARPNAPAVSAAKQAGAP